MGTTNHGNQTINFSYFDEATGELMGTQNLGITPLGIYSGGYLTKVSDSSVTLSSFIANVRSSTHQVSVRSSASATLNSSTLDSGAISAATPYLVMRWNYVETPGNYVEIHAIALANRQQYDVMIGRCLFSGSTLTGFDYSDRTVPVAQSHCLKVEATPETEMYVRVRGGVVNIGLSKVVIPDQKVGPFAVPSAGLSRIDLVYVTYAGAVAIQQGTPASTPTVPSYVGKMVLAEVRVVNGDTNITWGRITDARSFLSYPSIPDEETIGLNSSGRLYAIRDSLAPHYNVTVCDANNLTLPSQFEGASIITFKDPSFGTIAKTGSFWGQPFLFNNSTRFRMNVSVTSNITKTLKLFSVDDKVYVYVDGSLVYSRTTTKTDYQNPISINLVLAAGNRTIDIIHNDNLELAHLCLVGNIVDNTTVFYRSV